MFVLEVVLACGIAGSIWLMRSGASAAASLGGSIQVHPPLSFLCLLSSSHFCTLLTSEFSASFLRKRETERWNSGTEAQISASSGGSYMCLRGVKS